MRQIKFIGWSKDEQRWLPVREYIQSYNDSDDGYTPMMLTAVLVNGEHVLYDVDKGFPVRQFTSLIDKAGCEIYEGDIIRWHYGKSKSVVLIEWSDELPGYILGGWSEYDHPDTKRYAEVIGNSFEHPELLK